MLTASLSLLLSLTIRTHQPNTTHRSRANERDITAPLTRLFHISSPPICSAHTVISGTPIERGPSPRCTKKSPPHVIYEMDEIKLSNGVAAPPIHHNIKNEGEKSRVYLYFLFQIFTFICKSFFQINTSNTLLAATEMDAVPLLPLASIFDSLMHKSRPIDLLIVLVVPFPNPSAPFLSHSIFSIV